MGKLNGAADFEALDACHLEIQQQLCNLADLVDEVSKRGLTPAVQAQAKVIEHFFSNTSRKHHLEEEAHVFPELIASGNEALVNAVQRLEQDHYWIEENWLVLGPQLSAVGSGIGWPDEAEFLQEAQIFLDLCNDHIALEESFIYPESKERLTKALTARDQRVQTAASA
jgi:hemerythrin-like domain-containing protein